MDQMKAGTIWYDEIWTVLSHGLHDMIGYYDTMWYQQVLSFMYLSGWHDTTWYDMILTSVIIHVPSHGSHDTIRYYDTMWYEQMSSLTYFLMDHTIRYDTILRPSDNRVVQYYKCHHCCTLYNISMQLNLTICWNCHSHTLLYYVCLICTMIYTMIFCVICTMILIFTMICKLKRYYCTMIFYHDMYHDVDM